MITHCMACNSDVEPVKKFNWIAFIFFTLFYLPVYILKSKRCPNCKAKLKREGPTLNNSTPSTTRVAAMSYPSTSRLSFDESQVVTSGIQAMETIYIVANSKALDTIQGRYQFLLERWGVLCIFANELPTYSSMIQKSIDRFKEIHYNAIPEAYQMELVLRPQTFDVVEFYCQSLVNSFYRFAHVQVKEIESLKREDAKRNRALKIKSVLEQTIQEIHENCKSAQSYNTSINQLDSLRLGVADDPLNVTTLLSK